MLDIFKGRGRDAGPDLFPKKDEINVGVAHYTSSKTPRLTVWFSNSTLKQCGFTIGITRFDVVGNANSNIELVVNPKGKHGLSAMFEMGGKVEIYLANRPHLGFEGARAFSISKTPAFFSGDKVSIPDIDVIVAVADDPHTHKKQRVIKSDKLDANACIANNAPNLDYVKKQFSKAVMRLNKLLNEHPDFSVHVDEEGFLYGRYAFKKAVEKAGLKNISPHDIRRSAAIWMIGDRVPMSEVSSYLGHSNTNITETAYAHYQPDHLREAAKALEF